MANLSETLLAALVNQDKIAIVSVVADPGVGTTAAINAFAKSEDIDFIDIRSNQLDATDFLNGYAPVRHFLKTSEPVLILVDEVNQFTFDRAQKIINQVHEEARGKVVIVLVSTRDDVDGGQFSSLDRIADMHGDTLLKSDPIDMQSAFVEFLRETKKSDTHVKVADFIEEHGLSGATPAQWQAFAISYDMRLFKVASMSLNDEDLAKRFEAFANDGE